MMRPFAPTPQAHGSSRSPPAAHNDNWPPRGTPQEPLRRTVQAPPPWLDTEGNYVQNQPAHFVPPVYRRAGPGRRHRIFIRPRGDQNEVLLDNVLGTTSSMEEDLDRWLIDERAFIRTMILQMQYSSLERPNAREVLGILADIVPDLIFARLIVYILAHSLDCTNGQIFEHVAAMARSWHVLIKPDDSIGLLRNAQHVRFTLRKYLEHILACDSGGTIVKDLSIWDTRSLCAILTSHPTADAVVQSTGEVARNLVNLIQACVDNGRISVGSKQRLVRTLVKLSKSSNGVPQALFLDGVNVQSEHFAQGSFGTVHRGFWNGQEVAVKMVKVKRGKTIEQLAAEAAREAVTHRHLEHLNITPFYGVFHGNRDESPAVCLVSALMRSNLQDFLYAKGDNVDCIRLPWVKPLMTFDEQVLDVAQGLEYIHQENIVHSDLKSMNVLVSANERAFLADFGIAKSVDTNTNKQTPGLNGTHEWMAPELFKKDGSVAPATKESDIFAFGIVCYEVRHGYRSSFDLSATSNYLREA
ncbi:hypothetical protein HWV62_29595 [Athelia sp. TMB]|nr:hypothetical protein HWV62_29595 [Athelia sp. TMB]